MTNHNSRPLIPVNPQGLDDIAEALLKTAPTLTSSNGADIDVPNKEAYMILEGREHKNGANKYEYGDLFVGLHRIGVSPAIEKVRTKLGFEVANTAQEQDGTNYIGNIDWHEGLKLNLKMGGRTLTPRQGIDFIMDLREGIAGRKTLYYGNGKVIPANVLQQVHNEIVEVRNPYRAEWFDADFKVVSGVLNINYSHELGNKDVLVPRFHEPLESFLDESEVMVSLKDFSRHGLPTKKTKKGDIHHWKPLPDNNSVAGFVANSGWAFLDCGWVPAGRYAELGVRHVRAKK